MALKVTGMYECAAALDRAVEKRMEKVAKILAYVGEAAVKSARESHRYKDRTGNLTSSIGYVVVRDGQIINSSAFNTIKAEAEKRGRRGKQGQMEGKEYAEYLATKCGDGLVLIIVAGMKYAYYVNKRGYNVTDSAELTAKMLVPELLARLK